MSELQNTEQGAKVKEIASSGANVHVDVIGKSFQDRDLYLLTLGANQTEAAKKPATKRSTKKPAPKK